MEARICLTTGDVCSFDLAIDEPSEFLSKIRPNDVFERPVHQFLGGLRTVSINPSAIEWIEFDTVHFPSQAPFAKTLTMRLLTPEAFGDWVNKNKTAMKAAMESDGEKNVLLAYGMSTFRSGKTLHFEIRARIERNDERIKHSQKIFSMPALFVYGPSSTLYLINTKNILIWQVVPGLKRSTFFSVPGELTGIKKAR